MRFNKYIKRLYYILFVLVLSLVCVSIVGAEKDCRSDFTKSRNSCRYGMGSGQLMINNCLCESSSQTGVCSNSPYVYFNDAGCGYDSCSLISEYYIWGGEKIYYQNYWDSGSANPPGGLIFPRNPLPHGSYVYSVGSKVVSFQPIYEICREPIDVGGPYICNADEVCHIDMVNIPEGAESYNWQLPSDDLDGDGVAECAFAEGFSSDTITTAIICTQLGLDNLVNVDYDEFNPNGLLFQVEYSGRFSDWISMPIFKRVVEGGTGDLRDSMFENNDCAEAQTIMKFKALTNNYGYLWDAPLDQVFTSPHDDEVNDMVIDSQNNLYVVGYLNLQGIIKKFDSAGVEDTINWDKEITIEDTIAVTSHDIVIDNLGDIYVGGSVYISGGVGSKFWIKKFNSEGVEDLSWDKLERFSNTDFERIMGLVIDSENNLYVHTRVYAGMQQIYYKVYKFSPSGDMLTGWNKQFSHINHGIRMKDILVDQEDNVYVAIPIVDSESASDDDIKINKYSGGGTLLWSEVLPTHFDAHMATDADNNIYVMGSIYALRYIDGEYHGKGRNLYVQKFNSDGDELNAGGVGLVDCLDWAVDGILPEGSICTTTGKDLIFQGAYPKDMVISSTNNLYTISSINLISPTSSADFWISKRDLNSINDRLWGVSAGYDDGSFDIASAIVEDLSGDVYVGGYGGYLSGEFTGDMLIKKFRDGTEISFNNEQGRALCYTDIFGTPYTKSNQHECNPDDNNPKNDIMWLNDVADSPGTTPEDGGSSTDYNIPVCYGDLSCRSTTGVCKGDERVVARLSDAVGGHIVAASDTSYPLKICCGRNYCMFGNDFVDMDGVKRRGECLNGFYSREGDYSISYCNDLGGSGSDSCSLEGEAGCWISSATLGNQCCGDDRTADDYVTLDKLKACVDGTYHTPNGMESKAVCTVFGGANYGGDCGTTDEDVCWAESENQCCGDNPNAAEDYFDHGSHKCYNGDYYTNGDNSPTSCNILGGPGQDDCNFDGEFGCWIEGGPTGNKCCGDDTDGSDNYVSSDVSGGVRAWACVNGGYYTDPDRGSGTCYDLTSADKVCSNGVSNCFLEGAISYDKCCFIGTSFEDKMGVCVNGYFYNDIDFSPAVCYAMTAAEQDHECDIVADSDSDCWAAASTQCCVDGQTFTDSTVGECVDGDYSANPDSSITLCMFEAVDAGILEPDVCTTYNQGVCWAASADIDDNGVAEGACCGDDIDDLIIDTFIDGLNMCYEGVYYTDADSRKEVCFNLVDDEANEGDYVCDHDGETGCYDGDDDWDGTNQDRCCGDDTAVGGDNFAILSDVACVDGACDVGVCIDGFCVDGACVDGVYNTVDSGTDSELLCNNLGSVSNCGAIDADICWAESENQCCGDNPNDGEDNFRYGDGVCFEGDYYADPDSNDLACNYLGDLDHISCDLDDDIYCYYEGGTGQDRCCGDDDDDDDFAIPSDVACVDGACDVGVCIDGFCVGGACVDGVYNTADGETESEPLCNTFGGDTYNGECDANEDAICWVESESQCCGDNPNAAEDAKFGGTDWVCLGGQYYTDGDSSQAACDYLGGGPDSGECDTDGEVGCYDDDDDWDGSDQDRCCGDDDDDDDFAIPSDVACVDGACDVGVCIEGFCVGGVCSDGLYNTVDGETDSESLCNNLGSIGDCGTTDADICWLGEPINKCCGDNPNGDEDYLFMGSEGVCSEGNYYTDGDISEDVCDVIVGEDRWDIGGDIGDCCGSDVDVDGNPLEFYRTKDCDEPGICISSTDVIHDGCCDDEDDCVNDNRCYSSGGHFDMDSDGDLEVCYEHVWYDGDSSPERCGDLGETWMIGAFCDKGDCDETKEGETDFCCGDDNHEIIWSGITDTCFEDGSGCYFEEGIEGRKRFLEREIIHFTSPDGQVTDAYCQNSEWLSRTKLITLELLDIVNQDNVNRDDYTLFCDNYETVLNYLMYNEDNGIAQDYFTGGSGDICGVDNDCVNNVCVLELGEPGSPGHQIIFGTSLNNHLTDGGLPFIDNLEGIPSSNCDDAVDYDGGFMSCDTLSVYFNNNTQSVIYSTGSIPLGGLNYERKFLLFLKNPFQRVFNFLLGVFEDEGSLDDYDYIQSTDNFDRLYMSKKGVKTIRGVTEKFTEPINKEHMTIAYTCYERDVCESVNNIVDGLRAQSLIGSRDLIKCIYDYDSATSYLTSNSSSVLFLWGELTARLRPEDTGNVPDVGFMFLPETISPLNEITVLRNEPFTFEAAIGGVCDYDFTDSEFMYEIIKDIDDPSDLTERVVSVGGGAYTDETSFSELVTYEYSGDDRSFTAFIRATSLDGEVIESDHIIINTILNPEVCHVRPNCEGDETHILALSDTLDAHVDGDFSSSFVNKLCCPDTYQLDGLCGSRSTEILSLSDDIGDAHADMPGVGTFTNLVCLGSANEFASVSCRSSALGCNLDETCILAFHGDGIDTHVGSCNDIFLSHHVCCDIDYVDLE